MVMDLAKRLELVQLVAPCFLLRVPNKANVFECLFALDGQVGWFALNKELILIALTFYPAALGRVFWKDVGNAAVPMFGTKRAKLAELGRPDGG